MSVSIKSEYLSAVISENGGELTSLTAEGYEWLWTAEPVWQRHAPLLFPFICNTKSKGYTVNGVPYKLGNHGFARDSLFAVSEVSESSARLTLCSSPETLVNYPYEFELNVTYTARGNTLSVQLEAENKGNQEMPFFVGGHPGFLCPFRADEGSVFEDYDVVYEKPETVTQELDSGIHTVVENGVAVPVTRELFKNDVFMKDKPNSSSVSLVSRKSGRRVTVSYDNSGCIAVWSPYDDRANFICLEPWASAPVYCCDTEELTKMPHAIRIKPEEKYSFGFMIEIG